MEWKNLIHNNTWELVINKLKEKKSWFLISFAIMFITIIIIPIIMRDKLQQGHIIVGMVEIFFLVFINCMIDFSYLHESRKLSYFVSKPITNIQKINIAIIANMIFMAILVVVLMVISTFADQNNNMIFDVFVVTVPWLITGILTAALSSILTGNTIAAGLATIINFTLPLSVLAITNYFFQIIEDIAKGFNSNILFNIFIKKIYRIDIIYFTRYIDKNFNPTYFLVLAALISILYWLVYTLSKRRKHERAGDLVVVDGYKNLISLLIASLFPVAFSGIFNNSNFLGKVASFIILSALAYYIINAVLEKSFKIKKYAIKTFIGFLVFFIVFIVTADVATNKFETRIPLASEISSIYLGQNTWVNSKTFEESKEVYNASEEFMKNAYNVMLYTDQSSIQSLIQLHGEVIDNQDYYNNTNFVIVYYYKNGEKLTRYYKLLPNSLYKGEKDNLIKNLVNSDEYKKKRLPFIYDDNYYNSLEISNLFINYNDGNGINKNLNFKPEELDIDLLRFNLKKDYDNYLHQSLNSLNLIIQNNNYFIYDNYINSNNTIEEKPIPSSTDFYSIEINLKNYSDVILDYLNFNFNKEFVNTINYLKNLSK